MDKTVISDAHAPNPIGSYNQAVIANGFVFTAGQIAIDPDTGKPIPCNQPVTRTPLKIYRGRSAKELGIKLTEGEGPHPLSKLDHALYLGRELQKAEGCLLQGTNYIQD